MTKKKIDHIFDDITDKTLEKTVEPMLHGDYVGHFVAEYKQLTTRINRLQARVKGYKFNPDDDSEMTAIFMLYLRQLRIMRDYLEVMKLRAEIEGIDVKKMTSKHD